MKSANLRLREKRKFSPGDGQIDRFELLQANIYSRCRNRTYHAPATKQIRVPQRGALFFVWDNCRSSPQRASNSCGRVGRPSGARSLGRAPTAAKRGRPSCPRYQEKWHRAPCGPGAFFFLGLDLDSRWEKDIPVLRLNREIMTHHWRVDGRDPSFHRKLG